MPAFILELQSPELFNKELHWINLLKCCIDERFNVANQLLEHRMKNTHDRIANRRIIEIEQNENLLMHYINVKYYINKYTI